jgi:hypothetical protein
MRAAVRPGGCGVFEFGFDLVEPVRERGEDAAAEAVVDPQIAFAVRQGPGFVLGAVEPGLLFVDLWSDRAEAVRDGLLVGGEIGAVEAGGGLVLDANEAGGLGEPPRDYLAPSGGECVDGAVGRLPRLARALR